MSSSTCEVRSATVSWWVALVSDINLLRVHTWELIVELLEGWQGWQGRRPRVPENGITHTTAVTSKQYTIHIPLVAWVVRVVRVVTQVPVLSSKPALHVQMLSWSSPPRSTNHPESLFRMNLERGVWADV